MNNDFKVIDDTLYSGVAAEDIIQRRKSPVIALIVALAGSALAVWSLTSDTMVDRGNLSSMLMLVGGLIAIVGFIKAGVTFKDELAPPADAAFATLYDVKDGDVTKHAVYVSSGATAEEIAVFEAKDADAAARVKTAVDQRIADLKEGFENYVPGEMTKLNNPVVEVKGKYVLLCICDKPDEARTVIDKLFA